MVDSANREFELRVGASLRRSIDAGLANTRFGVVVLSEAFFQKGWTNYELDGLVTRQLADDSYQLIFRSGTASPRTR